MKPEDVPEELAKTLGERLYDDYHEGCDETGCSGISHEQCEEIAREYLSLVLPAHEAMVRQRVAEEIEAQVSPAAGRSAVDFVGAAYRGAARIARGGQA